MKVALGIIAALIVAFFGYGFVQMNTPEGRERAKHRDAIELCWSDYEKKSLDPATKRFVAGACESMERKYEAQLGRKP